MRRFHVVLDANHGVGGLLGTRLLEALGCRVTPLGAEPDGCFAHPPEPLHENLQELCAAVPREQADLGFALDPDGDRLALVDENGRYLGEEYTLALVVDHVLQHRPGPVVTNVSTTQAVEDLARKYGCRFRRTRVGEANVVDGMLEEGAVVGGEGNGGVIDPRIGWVRDGYIGMALVLESLSRASQPLSRLVRELPQYHLVKDKMTLAPNHRARALAALQEQFCAAELDRTDGLRFQWKDQWLHVRPSNTEPVLRVLAEAPSESQARRLCQQAKEVLDRTGKSS